MKIKNKIYKIKLDSDVDFKLKNFTEMLEENEKIVSTSIDNDNLIISTVVETKKTILLD